jgi:hypothetical protein
MPVGYIFLFWNDQDFVGAVARMEKKSFKMPPSEGWERTFSLEATFADLPDWIPGYRLINREYVWQDNEHI